MGVHASFLLSFGWRLMCVEGDGGWMREVTQMWYERSSWYWWARRTVAVRNDAR